MYKHNTNWIVLQQLLVITKAVIVNLIHIKIIWNAHDRWAKISDNLNALVNDTTCLTIGEDYLKGGFKFADSCSAQMEICHLQIHLATIHRSSTPSNIILYVNCKLFNVEKFAVVELNCDLLENLRLHISIVWLNPIAQGHYCYSNGKVLWLSINL